MVDNNTIGHFMSGGKTNTVKAACLGGYIADQALFSATPNNLFENVNRTDQTSGKDYYLCFYIKNKDVTEKLDQMSYWLETPPQVLNFDTSVKFGLENREYCNKYKWFPSYTATGASFFEVADSNPLDLGTVWTIAAWFRTSTNYSVNGMIMNKGGEGSDSAGENMNYGIWMTSNEKIQAGFETGAGADNFVTSPLSYNDGLYHHALATYDGTTLKLFIDGDTTPVSTLSTSATPETNAKPLRFGANSRASDLFFTGEIDEVLIYDRVWNQTELINYWTRGTVPSANKIYHNKFGNDWGQLIAQTVANINTAPLGIEWHDARNGQPLIPNIGTLSPGEYTPIWVWWHVRAKARDRIDDPALFAFKFFITIQGTGGSGGIGGGNPPPPTNPPPPPPPTPDPVPDPPGGGGGNPPPTPTGKAIIFAGDWGCQSMTQQVVNLIIERAPNVVVSGGDNSYDSSVTCWITRMNQIKSALPGLTFKGVIGNHDNESSSKRNANLAFYGESVSFYSFNVENIHIICFDSEISFSTSSAQYAFIKADIEAARANPAIQWTMILLHKNFVTAETRHSGNQGNVTAIYMPILDTNQVDLILTGHNHNYQRTFPIRNNASDPETPIVTDATAGPYTQGVGRIHLVVGTGGRDSGSGLYSIDNSPAFNAFQTDSENGVLELVTSNNGQTLTGRFITVDGETLDTFVINR